MVKKEREKRAIRVKTSLFTPPSLSSLADRRALINHLQIPHNLSTIYPQFIPFRALLTRAKPHKNNKNHTQKTIRRVTKMNTKNTQITQTQTTQTQTPNHNQKPETLCWTCTHCTCAPSPDFLPLSKTLPDGRVTKQTVCPWAAELKPVPGWLATARTIKNSSDRNVQAPEAPEQTYTVHACPYYKPDLEARVSAMTNDELKRLLGLPYSFCDGHRKFVTQLAISYIKEMEKLAAAHKENPEAPYPKTKAERFAIRRAVVKKHKYYLECDLETLLEDAEQNTLSSNNTNTNDDNTLDKSLLARETRITKGDIALCDKAIKAMKRIEQSGFKPRKAQNNA